MSETNEQIAWRIVDQFSWSSNVMRDGRLIGQQHLVAEAIKLALDAKDAEADGGEWRQIPDYPRYEVSSLGYVRRRSEGHRLTAGPLLKPHRKQRGHLTVSVYRDGGRQWRADVHRLVALAFLGPPPSSEHMICHRNGWGEDCRPSNLYWGTVADNRADERRHRIEGKQPGFSSDPYENNRIPGQRRPRTLADTKRIVKQEMTARLKRRNGAGGVQSGAENHK